MKAPPHQRLINSVRRGFLSGAWALITSMPILLKAFPRLGVNPSINRVGVQPEKVIGLILILLVLSSCASRPKTYFPPDQTKLKASTLRVSKAVDSAHENARKAQGNVKEATQLAKEVKKETAALTDVPVTLVGKLNDLETKLDDTQNIQGLLEQDLAEATQAKAQVEKDKTDYFTSAQKLADEASQERVQRVSAEKKLSWYRWHWFGSWIVLGLGVLAIIAVAFLKFTGRLAIAGLKL